MNSQLFILTILFLLSQFVYGQKVKTPKDIQGAVTFLQTDCPDSVKLTIMETPDDKLIILCYPWDGKYNTIFGWTNRDNKKSKIKKYLIAKGISDNKHQQTIILIAFKQTLLGETFNEYEIIKPYKTIEDKWREEDKVRFTTDTIRGVYIPKDLEDCFKQIDSFWDDSTKVKFKQLTEDGFCANAHFGLGMWMRNNWQLWSGSRLSKYFNSYEIYHPDDMSGIILVSYCRYLNNKAIQFDEQIKFYKDYWEKSKKQEIEVKQKEFGKYMVADTVLFLYKYGYSTPEQEEKDYEDICIAKGEILEKDDEKFLLKIRLIESCDRKGIICYDNESYEFYNKKTKEWERPKKRIIIRMKKGQEKWFNYSNWRTNE